MKQIPSSTLGVAHLCWLVDGYTELYIQSMYTICVSSIEDIVVLTML